MPKHQLHTDDSYGKQARICLLRATGDTILFDLFGWQYIGSARRTGAVSSIPFLSRSNEKQKNREK